MKSFICEPKPSDVVKTVSHRWRRLTRKISILSLPIIFLIFTNSFATKPPTPAKPDAAKIAADVEKVQAALTGVTPSEAELGKVKPDLRKTYADAVTNFELKKDEILTQIRTLVGEKRYNDPSKTDDIGGKLRELMDAKTSAETDRAWNFIKRSIEVLNGRITKLKIYAQLVLQKGLEEFQKKLTAAQKALGEAGK